MPASSTTNGRVQPGGFYGGWITNDVVGAVQTRARHELVVSLHRYSMQVRGPMGRSLPKMLGIKEVDRLLARARQAVGVARSAAERLRADRRFGPMLQDWEARRAIPRRAKPPRVAAHSAC